MKLASSLAAIGCALACAVAPLAAAAQSSAPPPSKAWQAWENRMPGVRIEPGKTTLLIAGEVETSHEAVKAVLKKLGDREGETDALEVELSFQGDAGVSAAVAAPAFRSIETLIIVPMHKYKRIYVLHQGAPVSEQPISVRPAY